MRVGGRPDVNPCICLFHCDACRPASAGGEVYVQFVCGRKFARLRLPVCGIAVGIYAVAEDDSLVAAGGQEREVYRQVARCPVGHGGDEPGVALAACQDDVFAHLAVQGDGLVEGGGHLCDEVGVFRLFGVLRGAVGQHLQRCFEDGVHRHLVYACALRHGLVVDAAEVPAVGVHRGAGRVVHRACQLAQVGDGDVVAREVVHRHAVHRGFPFAVLQALDAFEVHQVRIGSLQAERFHAVQVQQEVVAGGAGGNLFDGLHGGLVVAVEEVNLEAFDAQLLVVGEVGLGVAGGVPPGCPEDDAYPFLVAVGDEFGQIDVGVEVFGQRFGCAPSVVDDDVFQFMLGGEIYVSLVRRGVHACLEVDSAQVAGVPPVPCHLAGLDPRRVVDAAGRRQALCHVVVGQLGVLGCYQHGTPGQGARPVDAGDVVRTLRGDEVKAVVSADEGFRGDRCEGGLHALAGFFVEGEEHAGIVFHTAVHDGRFLAVGHLYQQRCDGQ